jgi:hypothetical protein
MTLKCEEVYAKIEARLAKVDHEHHKVHHIYKFKITQDGVVVDIWSEYYLDGNCR